MGQLPNYLPSPLPSPLRLFTLKRMTDRLAGITVANGYKTDLAGKVFRGRALFGEGDPIPMLSILEVPIPVDQQGVSGSQSKGDWELMIQGFAEDDRDNPTDPAHVMLADVKMLLGLEKKSENWDNPQHGIFGLGGIVDKMYIGSGVVRPADEISAKAYFWLTITLGIVEDLADPYNA
jgi:hypothetical protein